MKKLNSARILLIAALFILTFTTLNYAAETIINGTINTTVEKFTKAYIDAIKDLMKIEPEAVSIFNGYVIDALKYGHVKFVDQKTDITDIRNAIKSLKTDDQISNNSEAADRIFTLKEEKEKDKRERDERDVRIRVSENTSSDNHNPGGGQGGGGDADQGSMPNRPLVQ